jgi:WD40 repeat protein
MARVATLAGFVVVTFTWTSAVQMSMPAVAQESQPTEATAPLPRLCQNLQPVHTLKGHLGPVSDIEISSDNTKVITSSADGSVKVWDIETGQLEKSFFDVISYYWSPTQPERF